jgi:hypothetical protein
MQYRFKLKQTQAKNSKVLFTSGWFQAYSVLDAILVKDDFIAARQDCETKGKYIEASYTVVYDSEYC